MLDDFKYTSLIFSYGCFPVITSYLLSEKTELQNQCVNLTVCFWSVTSHVIFLEYCWLVINSSKTTQYEM